MNAGGITECGGIHGEHKNAGKSAGHSCVGQDSTAHDPSALVAVPAGLGKKIDGGLTSTAAPGCAAVWACCPSCSASHKC